MKRELIVLMLTGPMSMPVFAEPVTYNIDPTHTNVIASWNHFGFSNPKAAIEGASGTIRYDKDKPEQSSIEVSVAIKTIDTFVPKLTEEFLSGDYFSAAEFPVATFKSTQVSKSENGYKVQGDLTIKDVTKTVVFDSTLNGMGTHPMTQKPAIGFDAKTVIKRSDFGLDMYVPHVSDEVSLAITVEAQAN